MLPVAHVPDEPLARRETGDDPLGHEGLVEIFDDGLDRVPGAALSPRARGTDQDDELVGPVPARAYPEVRAATERGSEADEELDQDRDRVCLGRRCERADELADDACEGSV